MRKILTLKGLQKKANNALSKYICKRDHNLCVTCSSPGDEAGHFLSRSLWGTRYDERNVHCQNYRCNICLKGNMVAYYEFMEQTYGKKIISELKRQSHWTVIEFVNYLQGNPVVGGITTSRQAYEYIIEYYKMKLEKLQYEP